MAAVKQEPGRGEGRLLSTMTATLYKAAFLTPWLSRKADVIVCILYARKLRCTGVVNFPRITCLAGG